MDKINVDKQKLLKKLRVNREIHLKEYKEVFIEYQKDTIKAIQKLLRDAKKVPEETVINTYIGTIAPTSNIKDYDVAIGMLEFSVADIFDITQQEYKQFVLNEWKWSERFEMAKSTYLK